MKTLQIEIISAASPIIILITGALILELIKNNIHKQEKRNH